MRTPMRRLPAVLALAAAALVLATCGSGPDRAQADLCRLTLPVLNPDDATIRVLRTVDAGERAVRVDYVVERHGRSRQRWALCSFGLAPGPNGRPDLVSLDTDDGPVSGASLYLMERFWLFTPDAVAADPGAAGG